MDTGADLSHPDLAASLWVNPGEIPGNGIDDDGNGAWRGKGWAEALEKNSMEMLKRLCSLRQ